MADAIAWTTTDGIAAAISSRSYIVSVDSDPAAVDSQWRQLESTGATTPFQSQAWLLPWYRIVAPAFGITPVLITVRETACGQPLMLLPCCLRKKHGIARIEFPDLNVSDYNAPLLAPNFQPSSGEFIALWDKIVSALPRADFIRFEKIPEFVANRPNPMAGLPRSELMRGRAWDVELPASRAAYDQTLKSVVRKELRRKRRNLEREGPVRYVTADLEAHGRRIFEALQCQRELRWGREILGNPVFKQFYEAVIFENWSKRFGTLSALMVRDEIAAALFALKHRDRYLLLVHSYEVGRWGTKSPGIVAIDSAITDQIEASTKYFDFTVGNEPYKLQFGVREKLLYRYEQPLGPLGHMYMAAQQGKRLIGKQVRRLLPRNYLPQKMRD